MSSNPFITVVIPTFNRENVLCRCLKSIVNQTYKNFELIIIDDGSTDNTEMLVESFRKEHKDYSISYIKTENHGVSAARNTGIKKAKGEWIAFLDSDDEWLKDKLQFQVDFIKKNPMLKLIHGDEIWIKCGKRVNQKNIHKKSGGIIFQNCLKLCLISPSAVIIKKDLLFEMDFFDEDYLVCEDYDLWLKITSLYEVGFIEDSIIKKYGGHEDQLSAKYFAMDYYRVKSMYRILSIRNLSIGDKSALLKELRRKCQILLKGYKKHGNMKDYREINEIFLNIS